MRNRSHQFADALDKAADIGDLSGLPQQAQKPHGHHHQHGGHKPAADGSSSDTDTSGSDAASTSSSGAGRKATNAYQGNMPSPTDMLNQILTQLS